jgi:SpoVK/Ycf46/Vps4 family AAA+-type ATPase
VLSTFVSPYIHNLLDPDRERKERASSQARAHIDRLRRDRRNNSQNDHTQSRIGPSTEGPAFVDTLELNEYETRIALEMVAATDIPVGFKDIAGLDNVIEELRETVIYPLMMPHLYSHASSLLSAPSGVLLYGPPGCGKTMLAKALARESGASFINLHISTLTEKWYGDSNKLVRAVFSLARKMEPAIIFIDEIDALLGTRRSGEHEASGMVKAEFMTLWDGLMSAHTSGNPQRIMVLGATNRINEIDEAILRRMPKRFPVNLPNNAQRRSLLQLLLRDIKLDPTLFNLDYIERITAGMSGSDIKEACRDAAMTPLREYLRLNRGKDDVLHHADISALRGLRNSDFLPSSVGTGTNLSFVHPPLVTLAQHHGEMLPDTLGLSNHEHL